MTALWRLALVSACSLALPALPARAAGGEGADRAPVKKAAQARKDAAEKLEQKRQALKDAIRDKREAASDAGDESKAAVREARKDVAEARKELVEAWAKLRETRKERRQARREEIKKKWGDLSRHPAVKNELKLHAWRMARLKRIRAVAESEGKKDTVARVDRLMEKEKERHDKRMEHLKSKGGVE